MSAASVLLQLRRPGGDWGEPMRCEGLGDRTELIAFPVGTGAWEWRLRLPTRGADNRSGDAWREGRCEAPPGGRSVVEVPAR